MAGADDHATGQTSGGSTVYRYDEAPDGWTPPEYYGKYIEDIEAHVEQHIGPIETVMHEVISDKIHLDVLVVEPDGGARPYWTFVTSGMSDLPMKVPESLDDPELWRRAELMICLPTDAIAIKNYDTPSDDSYYPISFLKMLARFPHDYGTWFAAEHTMPNGDPPEPIGPDTKMSGWILGWPEMTAEAFDRMTASDGEIINIYAVYPIYADEMTLKLNEGSHALFAKLNAASVNEIYHPERPSVVKRKKLFGLF